MAILSLSVAMAEIKTKPKMPYVYVLSRPDGTPFYVGMGIGRRVLAHERNAAERWRGHKYSIIRNIVGSGRSVGYSVSFFNTREEVVEEERRLITLFGRINKKTGTLTNLTDGGEGSDGIVWVLTPRRIEGAKRAAEKNRGRKQSEERRAMTSKLHKGRKLSASHIANMSAALKGRKLSSDHCEKLAERARDRQMNENTRAGLASFRSENPEFFKAHFKKLWERPGYKEKMSKALSGVKRNDQICAENKVRQKAKFADPEFRARWDAARLAGIERRKFLATSGKLKKISR